MNIRSIRFRLVAWYTALMVGFFALLTGLLYNELKVHLEHSLRDSQVQRAEQIGQTLLAKIDQTGDEHVISEINEWFSPYTSDRFIRITRANGSLLYLSQSPKDKSYDSSLVRAYKGPTAKRSWRTETLSSGRRLLIAAVPAKADTGGTFVVEVGASLESIEALLDHLLLLLALVLGAMAGVGTAGGYLLVRRALAPVDKIASSAEQITFHNLKERLPVARTGDELERLSISLNHMIAQLEGALEQNRRFLADASHELRTPLTVIRGELEAMVKEPRSEGEVQECIGSILEEAERLARIVEALFAISRLDAGEAQRECMRFDLARLASNTAEQMCLLAEDKQISITCHSPREVVIEGDRARLKQVVVNLLDNAIKYTPQGGRISLTVVSVNEQAILEVEDTGIGIPMEAKPHIFERFFRVDQARSREMGGTGLGLSIVKSICAAHGGRVGFQSQAGCGSRFKVELPLAEAISKHYEEKNLHEHSHI